MTATDRSAETSARGASAVRILRFTAVMYKPQYLLYGVAWTLAFEGTSAHLGGRDWHPTTATVTRVGVVIIVLLYLRMVDEQKDLEYDRVHNPGRPLVTGAVTATDLRVAMGIIAVVAVGVSAALSVGSALMIALVLAYGLALWVAETWWPALGRAVLPNLVVTYPVQLLVAAYVVVSAIDTGELGADRRIWWAVAIVTGTFLQFEFARKISRRPRSGEMYYSNPLGAVAAVAVSLSMVALALGASLVAYAPWQLTGIAAIIGWLPVAAALIPVAGALWFGWRDDPDYPAVPAVVFVLVLYAVLIVAASVVPAT